MIPFASPAHFTFNCWPSGHDPDRICTEFRVNNAHGRCFYAMQHAFSTSEDVGGEECIEPFKVSIMLQDNIDFFRYIGAL